MMNKKILRVTAEQTNVLLKEVFSLPKEVVGVCLTEDQIINYVFENTTAEELASIELHISSCDECLTKLEEACETFEAILAYAKQNVDKKSLSVTEGVQEKLAELGRRVQEVLNSHLRSLQLRGSFASEKENGEVLTVEPADSFFRVEIDTRSLPWKMYLVSGAVHYAKWQVTLMLGDVTIVSDLERQGDKIVAHFDLPNFLASSESAIDQISFGLSPNGS